MYPVFGWPFLARQEAGFLFRGTLAAMKILLVVLLLVVVAGSVYADYRWRMWVSNRRRERDEHDRDLRA
jgi:hypothetical protein